jgi:hypothetical protein
LTRGGPQRNRSSAEGVLAASFPVSRDGSFQANGRALPGATWPASTELAPKDVTIEFQKIGERGLTLGENRRILAFVIGA